MFKLALGIIVFGIVGMALVTGTLFIFRYYDDKKERENNQLNTKKKNGTKI